MLHTSPLLLAAGRVPLFPWAKQKALESNFTHNHELAQEEARQARWDLGRRDRLPVRWWFQRTETEYHHQGPWSRSRSIPGRRGKQRLLSQKETFGPIKWQLSKLQENAAQFACTSALNIYVFSDCPVTARVRLFGERKGCWPPVTAPI